METSSLPRLRCNAAFMRVLYVRATDVERINRTHLGATECAHLGVTERGADLCALFRGDDVSLRVWRFASGLTHPNAAEAQRDFPRHVGKLSAPRFYTDGSVEAILTLDALNDSSTHTLAPTWDLQRAIAESCDAYARGNSATAPLHVVVMSTATLSESLNLEYDVGDDDATDEQQRVVGIEQSRICAARLSITMFDVLLDLDARCSKSTVAHCIGNTALCPNVAWWFNSEKA